MGEDFSDFLKKSNIIAVVGASRNKEKFGYKIYATLRHNGYVVYPVNPNAEEIYGDKCYPSLAALPKKPDVVITAVPPKITEEIARQMKESGLKRIWMQPGSESPQAITFCKQNGIKVIANACFVVDGLKTNFV